MIILFGDNAFPFFLLFYIFYYSELFFLKTVVSSVFCLNQPAYPYPWEFKPAMLLKEKEP